MEPLQQKHDGGQILVAVLIGMAGSGILFSASLAIPLFGFVSAFLAPVPLGFARIKGGAAAAGFAAIITTLLMAVLLSPAIAAWYAAQCALVGLMIPELALRGLTPSRVIVWTTAAAMLLAVVLIAVISVNSGKNPLVFAQKEISAGIEQASRLYEQNARLSQQDMDNIRQGLKSVGKLMASIYPGLATINLGLVCAVSLLFFQRIAVRSSVAVNLAGLADFRTPEFLVWPLIVSGFAMLAPSAVVNLPAFNILVVLGVLYFFQGLAVSLTFISRTSYPGVLKVLLAVLLLSQPYLAFILTVLGIFDLWGDFRTPGTKQQENL